MDINLNKTAVVDYLCSNYEKFNWQRDNSSFDINMSVGNYMYRLSTTHSDGRYLQVITKGASLGVEVSAKEYKAVADLYDLLERCQTRQTMERHFNRFDEPLTKLSSITARS